MFLERNTTDIPVPGSSDSKELACDAADPGSIPGLGRSSRGGNGYPLQYSCLENSMDRGAWWATVHGVCKSKESDMTEQLTLFHQVVRAYSWSSVHCTTQDCHYHSHFALWGFCSNLVYILKVNFSKMMPSEMWIEEEFFSEFYANSVLIVHVTYILLSQWKIVLQNIVLIETMWIFDQKKDKNP